MLTQRVAQKVLSVALSSGGDFAEIYMEDNLSNSTSFLNGKVENANKARFFGAGIRVYDHYRSAYAYTNLGTEEGLIRAAEQAAQAIGEMKKTGGDLRLFTKIPSNFHPVGIVPGDVEGKRYAEALREACTAAKEYSPEISQVLGSIAAGDKTVWIANSDGLFVSDRRIRTRLSVRSVAADGNENQTGSVSPGALRGFEFIEGLPLQDLGKEASRIAVTMLHADKCPSGIMPVAIENGFGGVIFHEACAHSLEATSVAKGASVFCGKLGQKIAADCVTAVDDGTLPNEWGSINIDDEGRPSQRNVLIENGILKGYLIDQFNARRMGMEPTGSGRRQDYSYAPTSRMTNTFICPGKDRREEIFSTMGDGIYAAKLGGGSVNPVTGEFNFAVMEGYRVRDGKIAEPVRGATLIGKGDEILLHVDRVSDNLGLGQGMCGSLSGSIPVNVGQPLIRVTQITVGGAQ